MVFCYNPEIIPIRILKRAVIRITPYANLFQLLVLNKGIKIFFVKKFQLFERYRQNTLIVFGQYWQTELGRH